MCVRVCVHRHTGGRNRCMEHGRPEHPGTTTLSMASPPLYSQLPFWSAPLSPPSIRHLHSRDPHLLVFSRTSTFFRSSKFSVEQDSTLQRREKKKNLSFIRGASTKPGTRMEAGGVQRKNKQRSSYSGEIRKRARPTWVGEKGEDTKEKKKRKRLITNGSVMGNELEWCTM